MPNPNGTPENLVAAHPANVSRVVHGLFSEGDRVLAPRIEAEPSLEDLRDFGIRHPRDADLGRAPLHGPRPANERGCVVRDTDHDHLHVPGLARTVREDLHRLRLLGLRHSADAMRRLVFYCDGFPYFAHLLGLAIARLARARDDDYVDKDAVNAALARAAKDVSASFPKRVAKAFEAGGEVQPRRRILHTLCNSSRREWRGADMISEYSLIYGQPSDGGFLYAALGRLVQQSYGAVLTRRGTEKRFVYRFSDPYLRPFLRMTHFTEPIQQRLF